MRRLARSWAWVMRGPRRRTAPVRNPIARAETVQRIRPTPIFGCRSMTARCLPCQLPEFSHKSNLLKRGFRFPGGFGAPPGTEAVAVPELGQFPALGQRKRAA